MEPLDLTTRPPRGPREQLDGLCMLPRTIDKMRALLPGGDIGAYKIPGTSARVLDGLGIRAEDLQAAVAAAVTDDDVARWLRAHADPSRYPRINERVLSRSIADVEDKEYFYGLYPWARGREDMRLVEVMEEDDRRMFPG
jgi:hypothetical protein